MDVFKFKYSKEKNIGRKLTGICLKTSGVPGAMLQEPNSMWGTLKALRYPFLALHEIQWSQQVPVTNHKTWKEFRERTDTDEVFRHLHRNNHHSSRPNEYLNIFCEAEDVEDQ